MSDIKVKRSAFKANLGARHTRGSLSSTLVVFGCFASRSADFALRLAFCVRQITPPVLKWAGGPFP